MLDYYMSVVLGVEKPWTRCSFGMVWAQFENNNQCCFDPTIRFNSCRSKDASCRNKLGWLTPFFF